MRIEETLVLFSIIEAQYNGGIAEWFENGGNIIALPPPVNEVVVVAPEGVESDLIEEMKTIKGFEKLKVLYLPIPYPETSIDNVNAFLSKHKIERLSKFVSGILVIFFADSIDRDKIDPLKEMIQNSKDIPLTILFDQKGVIAKLESKFYQSAKEPAKMEAVNNKRETCINDDDLLNLKISLETMDVNTFINSI